MCPKWLKLRDFQSVGIVSCNPSYNTRSVDFRLPCRLRVEVDQQDLVLLQLVVLDSLPVAVKLVAVHPGAALVLDDEADEAAVHPYLEVDVDA